jgi:hypothetical protein
MPLSQVFSVARPSARDSERRVEYWLEPTLSEKLDYQSDLSPHFPNMRHIQTRQRWPKSTRPGSE